VLGRYGVKQFGSIPTVSTLVGLKVFMDARMPVTHKEGDRYPLRPPVMPR